jgi:hypothetical protein
MISENNKYVQLIFDEKKKKNAPRPQGICTLASIHVIQPFNKYLAHFFYLFFDNFHR